MQSQEGQYWQWRNEQIHYVRVGKSEAMAPVLLIHGFGASTDHWRKNITVLGQETEAWAIDLLGFGRSAKPNWQYSGDLWRDQLIHFIRDVVGKPMVLVGNSLGGYASLCVAADYPDWVSGVVLLNSAGPFRDSSPLGERPVSPIVKYFREIIQKLLRQPMFSNLLFAYVRQPSQIRKTLMQVYVDKSAVTDRLVAEIYRPSRDRGAAQVFASVFSSPQGRSVDQLLAQMTCPLFTIWGEGDPWMNSRSRATKFRQHYPSLTEEFVLAGHCPHDELPDQVNALIRNWLLFSLQPQKQVA